MPDVAAVAPVVEGSATLVSTSSNWSTTVQGSSPGWLMANARTLSDGSLLHAEAGQRTCAGRRARADHRRGARRHRRLAGEHLRRAVRRHRAPDRKWQHWICQQRRPRSGADHHRAGPDHRRQPQLRAADPAQRDQHAQRSAPRISRPINSSCRRITSPTRRPRTSASRRRRRWQAQPHRSRQH